MPPRVRGRSTFEARLRRARQDDDHRSARWYYCPSHPSRAGLRRFVGACQMRKSSGSLLAPTGSAVQVSRACLPCSQLKLPRVPLAAATADRLAVVVIAGSTVIAAAVSVAGSSPVVAVSEGLRLTDAQLYAARRHLR